MNLWPYPRTDLKYANASVVQNWGNTAIGDWNSFTDAGTTHTRAHSDVQEIESITTGGDNAAGARCQRKLAAGLLLRSDMVDNFKKLLFITASVLLVGCDSYENRKVKNLKAEDIIGMTRIEVLEKFGIPSEKGVIHPPDLNPSEHSQEEIEYWIESTP